MRPHGHPSVRWLYVRLARHIHQSARYLHQSQSNANRQFREELFERRMVEIKQLLVNELNHLGTEGFISSQMFSILYDFGTDVVQKIQSTDYDYVIGLLEGYFDSLYPHDEL